MDLDSPGMVIQQTRRKSAMVFLEEKVKAPLCSRSLFERTVSDFEENISIQQELIEELDMEKQAKFSDAKSLPFDCNGNQVSSENEATETIDDHCEFANSRASDDDGGDNDDDSDQYDYDNEICVEYVVDENNNTILLGQGAFGKVYLVRNLADKRKLAMKIIYTSTPADVEREIDIHRDLKHANIINLETWFSNEIEQNTYIFYIVMECIPGASLANLLMDGWHGAQIETVAVIYIRQLLNAVKFLHGRGVIHCDIKGQNILINDYDGILKLCDFGHAQKLHGGCGAITPNCGTPNYMAPEAIDIPSESGYGKAVDIWSLGCTVLEILTGNPPHHECDANIIMYQVGKYHKLPDFPKSISENCKDFLDRCFVIDPSKRATVEELLCHPFIVGSAPLKNFNKSPCGEKQPFEDSEDPREIGADGYENRGLSSNEIIDEGADAYVDRELPSNNTTAGGADGYDIQHVDRCLFSNDITIAGDADDDDDREFPSNDTIAGDADDYDDREFPSNHTIAEGADDHDIEVEDNAITDTVKHHSFTNMGDHQISIDYDPSTNVVVQKPKISKEMYMCEEHYEWNNQQTSANENEDKELTKLLQNLNIPQEEINKFIDEECTLNGLMTCMELKDLEDLKLKIEYRARVWHHVQQFRQKKEKTTGFGGSVVNGVNFCVGLFTEYMKI